MIPAYRRKRSMLHEVHPAAQLMLALSLALLSLLSSNPFCQISVIAAAAVLACSAGVFREWASWWKLCLLIFLVALVINPLVARQGATIIWQGPWVPVFGRLNITAEAVAYGAGMGLRLAAIIWVFALVTLTIDPDGVLGLLKGRGSKSALVSALSMRMVPTMMRDAGDLLDVQRSRGLARDEGGRWTVLKSRLPLLRRIFSTSLDRGIGLAEAMESRAYGSGKRTRYRAYRFAGKDAAMLAGSVVILGVSFAGVATGLVAFTYYPELSLHDFTGTFAVTIVPIAVTIALLVLSMLWKRSHWLKLRV